MAGSREMFEGCQTSYEAIVTALGDIHKNIREPEALSLSTDLSKHYTVVAIYVLDYVLLQVAKLSRTRQTEHLELSVVSKPVSAYSPLTR